MRHLEEWSLQDLADGEAGRDPEDGVLQHLEEWQRSGTGEDGDPSAMLEPRADLRESRAPLRLDREHPLWDRELDA